MSLPNRHTLAYGGLLIAAFALALTASWTPLGTRIDNYVYDTTFRLYRTSPWRTESIILAIDEPSLTAYGGRPGLRRAVAAALELIAPVSPKAVAVDVIPADNTADAKADDALEASFRAVHNLILPCDLTAKSGWDDPLPRFSRWAAAIGHVHLEIQCKVFGQCLLVRDARVTLYA